MKPPKVLNLTTYGMLCLTGAISFLLPETLTIPPISAAPADGDEIQLTGLLRDFKAAHPDFGLSSPPTGGYGHVAGLVEMTIPDSGHPQLQANAFKVDDQWRDKDSRPIAPHLYEFHGLFRAPGDGIGFRVSDKIEFKDETMCDAFDSNFGPYGVKGNYGGLAIMSTNSVDKDKVKVAKKASVKSEVYCGPGGNPNTVIKADGYVARIQGPLTEAYAIPELFMPDELDASFEDEILIEASEIIGKFEEQTYLHAGDFEVRGTMTVLTIEGDVLIRCDNELKIKEAQIVLGVDATLSFYSAGRVEIDKDAIVNASPGDTAAVSIYVIGGDEVKIKDKAHAYATIIAPDSKLTVQSEGQFYGGFIGKELKVENKGSGIHADRASVNALTQNYGLVIGDKLELKERAAVDGFDSSVGVYGGTNVGYGLASTNSFKDGALKIKNDTSMKSHLLLMPQAKKNEVIEIDDDATHDGVVASMYEPIPLPVLTPPTIGASVGKLEYKGGGPYLIDANTRCKELKIEGATLNISGDVVIRIDKKLELKHGHIVLLPDSSLTLSIREEIKIEGASTINMTTGDPSLVVIRKETPDKKQIEIKNDSKVAAYIQSNKSELKLKDKAEFFGSFVGEKATFEKDSIFHIDTAHLHMPTDCLVINDFQGTAGVTTSAAITSSTTFSEWFRTIPDTNMAGAHTFSMTKTGGVWEFTDNEFYPADDRMLGDEGDTHNYNFTYELQADFVYNSCTSQFFEFDGGDGAWMYVAGTLVLDLGGVRTDYEQYIDLDRLGLENGKTYRMALYVAQRQGNGSTFSLRTNVALSTENVLPQITAAFD